MTLEIAFLVGRVLFGGYFAFSGVNHLTNLDSMTGYADSKGVPAARAMVALTGAMMLLGGLGIAFGAYPAVSIALIALFLIVATPWMHDFWSAPEEQRQQEMTQFMKNTALLGAALTLLAADWTVYAVEYGLGIL